MDRVGINTDYKLVVSLLVGNRYIDSINEFMDDIASRSKNRVQLTLGGLSAYIKA